MNPPRDTHEMEAMLFEPETRAIANGMIARMQAFVAKWRDQRESHETPAAALRRVRWMLKAIGAKVPVIPGANHGDARERIARYLITFDSPLGWQSLQILETNESLYAKLGNQLDRMEAFIIAFPEHPPHSGMDHDDDPSETAVRSCGLLEHALTMRFALEGRPGEECRIPVGFTPLASRALAAVMLNRTSDEWDQAANHDDFWRCTPEEYAEVRAEDIDSAIERMAKMRGLGQAKMLSHALDWKPAITISDGNDPGLKVNIISNGHRVWATAPDIVDNETTGTVSYYDDSIQLTNHDLPESMLAGLQGKSLDDVFEHWLTKGARAVIMERNDDLPKLTIRKEASYSIKPGPGPVFMLPADPEREQETSALRHPESLRTRKR